MAVNDRNDKEQEDGKMEEGKKATVYMWGYLPGVSPEKSPILNPISVNYPDADDSWKDVCGGGCGFAMAISEGGKLVTWGSADDENQSYVTCGKHGLPSSKLLLVGLIVFLSQAIHFFLLFQENILAKCLRDTGELYTWGWKECVPLGKFPRDGASWGALQKDNAAKQNVLSTEQVSSASSDDKRNGEEIVKRRRVSLKEENENSEYGDEYFTVTPAIVSLGPGVRITSVAAGGRHTLALSDTGQVWGWGYGGEGQLGLGSRVKMVSSPHLIPFTEQPATGKHKSSVVHNGSTNLPAQVSKFPGSYVKEIACGGRHSAVVTDAGTLLTFGWGLYGQCGHGSTNDQLRPTSLPSLSGIEIERIAAGLWHTMCITIDGRVYVFGGNQFGQLGTGASQGETLPRLLEDPCLESKLVKMVSCGARHSAILLEDGQVFSWGWNKYGQLGVGDSIDRNTPTQVPIEGCRPKMVACGWWHTLLLAETPLKT